MREAQRPPWSSWDLSPESALPPPCDRGAEGDPQRWWHRAYRNPPSTEVVSGLLAQTGPALRSAASSQQGRVLMRPAREAAVLGQPGPRTCTQIPCEGAPGRPTCPAWLGVTPRVGPGKTLAVGPLELNRCLGPVPASKGLALGRPPGPQPCPPDPHSLPRHGRPESERRRSPRLGALDRCGPAGGLPLQGSARVTSPPGIAEVRQAQGRGCSVELGAGGTLSAPLHRIHVQPSALCTRDRAQAGALAPPRAGNPGPPGPAHSRYTVSGNGPAVSPGPRWPPPAGANTGQ